MKQYAGGDKVNKGTYMNLKTGEFFSLEGKESVLPPPQTTRYLNIPVGLVLLVGPIVGLAYIIFIPLAGIASVFMLTAQKIKNWSTALAHRSSEG